MKTVILFTVLIFLFGQISAQDLKKEQNPDEQIIVNKKYDENGNLIQFDSTYIHQWSSDSTFRFSFPEDNFFARNEFFNNFLNDSALKSFYFSPFFDEKFFEQFPHHFSDSLLNHNFPFEVDSSFLNFQFDSLGNFPQKFSMPEFEEFQKQFNEHFQQFSFPELNNQEQIEEWKKLMEKYELEMEELKNKWNENK